MDGRSGKKQADLTQALHTLENSPNAPEELRGLLRELQRHQLELELQNRELQEAQQALEESRNRYMELYDFAPMACASLDANGCIQDLNLTGANLLGQNRSYLQGLPFTPFVDPVDVGRFFGHLRQCIDGETVSTELRLRIARRQVEVRLVSAPLEDTGSPVRMCRTAIFDITELRQMQVRLSLAERLAAVGTLAAGIAHEVNNPLAFLMGSLSLATHALRAPAPSSVDPELLAVARHHTGASQALEALGHAQAGAERIQDIVKDLGAFARPTAPRERSVNVEQVLELALKMAMVEIQHRAHVVRDYTPVPEVVADSVRLGQVFLNLLVNAAQAIPEGMASRHEIRVRLRASAEGVFVHIQDTGEGMAPDILEHIFDPFFTTRPMGQGLGLGLAISHNLVSQMNGAITVDSAPDQGSTFTVRLPAAPSPVQPRVPPPPTPPPTPLPRGRILIVDDERSFGATLRLLLMDAHEVTYTPSAKQALEWLREGRRYDAILCDLMMAEVTGKQFHAALREQAPEQALRIIFMTGGAYTPSSREFVEQLTLPLIDKPFKRETLDALLAPLLARA
ncbi:ATP-binding protein [Corallococcus sp. BB11-1]|uniref:hybrid sensor histidine kinase/response regulator n=1 Tax=Corallococcus sp. BB11-1 TaxID=2996783 RepID=UPI0022714DBD|nr:ATP-binding protein [Corallococcus sp. BB11-1]MCY1035204.1 ATP-binding protein [Corallococcus sp. BB11-1]